jgi:predicted ATPase
MHITRLLLKNWRTFTHVDVPLRPVTYILGANATGKSNFLDALRFLRDVSDPQGGGLQKAVSRRGGMKKIRCLHARGETDVRIEVSFSDSPDDAEPEWHYALAFNSEPKGAHRVLIKEEIVKHKGRVLLERPTDEDKADDERLTETDLENVKSNKEFRDLVDFFKGALYLHLVPQLLKFGSEISGNVLENDPFGQGFLSRLAKTPEKTRDSRLNKIQEALQKAIPQFEELQFDKDTLGKPHLKARYIHHRPHGAWQNEDQFSDGTLRLISLLWSLLERPSLLLLEEPELSLNDAIVEQIPYAIHTLHKSKSKRTSQVLITTHSEALLRNKGIDPQSILILERSKEGSSARSVDTKEQEALEAGFSVAEVILSQTNPSLRESALKGDFPLLGGL